MPARNYYRGAYGDVAPVTVHPSKALDHEGKIRPDHYETEAAAWGNIMAVVADRVSQTEERYRRADMALNQAADDVVNSRANQRRTEAAYRGWKARHQLSAAV